MFLIRRVYSAREAYNHTAIAAKYAAEDLWISVLINFTIDGLAILLICRLANKFKGATVFEIVENTLGKTGKIIFAAAFYLFFTVKAYLPLIEHRNFVEVACTKQRPRYGFFCPCFFCRHFSRTRDSEQRGAPQTLRYGFRQAE